MPEAETQKKDDLTADDLDLLDPALEDAGKTDDELWSDFEAAQEPSDDESDDASKADADFETPPEDDEDQGKDEDEPADAGKSENQPDIWANASPEQKLAFEEAQKRASELEHRLRSDDGRVSSLQRKINRLEQEKASRKNDRDGRENVSAKEALERLKQEYPDIAEMLDPVLANVKGDVSKLAEAERIRDEMNERDLNESRSEYQSIVSANARTVEETHPGYQAWLIENQDAFVAWVEDQPRAIRAAAYANADDVVDAKQAIEVINRFKAHINPPAEDTGKQPDNDAGTQSQPLNDRRKRQLDASASPQRSARRPATSGVPDTDDEQAIWDALEAQEAAKRA